MRFLGYSWIRGAGRGPARRALVAGTAIVALAFVVVLFVTPNVMHGGVLGSGSAPQVASADWVPTYARDVEPIFQRTCIRCHGPERADKGLRLDSYQRIMAGDSYGTVLIPGDSSLSAIVSILQYGTMPHGGSKLPPEEIDTISRWIDAGAK